MAKFKRLQKKPKIVLTLTEDEAVSLRIAIFRAHRAAGPGVGPGNDIWIDDCIERKHWRHLYAVLHEASSGKPGVLNP